jgi:hypothetical protein
MPEMVEMPTHEVAMGTTEVWAMPSKVRDVTTEVTTAEVTATEVTAAEVTATEVTATEVTATEVTTTEVTATAMSATVRKSVGGSRQTAKRENCC